MAKEKTQKSKYTSRYGGGHVSAAQYLVEVICEKIAAKKKLHLPHRFWETKEWKNIFILQITHANKLLKRYPLPIILAALKDKDAWNVTSLGALYILNKLLEKHKKLEERNTPVDISPTNDIDITARPVEFRSSKKNTLKDLN